MVYESDFYTTRRYRTSPSLSTYTVSVPSYESKLGLDPRLDSIDYCFPELCTYSTIRRNLYKWPPYWASRLATPRYYVVTDTPERRAEQQYSYSYSSSTDRNSSNPYSYSSPSSRSYTTSERVNRSSGGGPGSYSYSTERSSRSSGDGPGGYHSSYSSTTSGRLPGGTSYRHYSYRV